MNHENSTKVMICLYKKQGHLEYDEPPLAGLYF